MTARADGYITELGYTKGYYRELSPMRVRLALLKAGLPAPDVATACELGFGQGVSLAIHAAASPASWCGTDLNAEHLASASRLVKAAGVEARLHQETFGEFSARHDLPDFDYIVLNGVWSWVSEENRRCVVDFVRRKLRAGGVLFISYNTLPGWAPFLSLRELLVGRANQLKDRTSPLIARIDDAIDYVARLIAGIPSVAELHPRIAGQIARIREQDQHYVAHEYFNESFCPMHFSTVAESLAPAGLTYAASSAIGELPSVVLERPQVAQLDAIADPIYREVVRDFLVNRSSRHDYWIKGPVSKLDDKQRAAQLRGTRLIGVKPQPELPPRLRAALALNRSGPSESVYRPILELLARFEPVSLATIEQELQSAGASLEQILDAVLLIAGHNQLEPVQDENAIMKTMAPTARLNAHLLDPNGVDGEVEHLASPVTGTGIRVNRVQRLFLGALKQGHVEPGAWAAQAQQALPEIDAAHLAQQARSFADRELPMLKALKVA